MKTEVRKINAEVAKQMLRKNPNNRKLSKGHVSFLARQMEEGKWQFDGQPIRLDVYGRLLDGQHRLSAVVESDSDIDFLIVSGLDEETFKTMDTGKIRSGGDALSAMGIKYSGDIAAMCKTVTNFKRGRRSDSGFHRVSNTDIISWYNENTHVIDLLKEADKLKSSFSSVLSRTFIASFMYLFNEKSVLHSEDFMRKLCVGLGIDTSSPIFVLRKKLIQDRMSKSSLPQREKMAIIIKAWNAYRLGKKAKVIRWNKETENFPELI